VYVRDDGRGLAQAAVQENGRFGVAGMRERVQALGGTFVISGAAGEGVTVRAVLPVASAERPAALETRA
jgi:signal transduction histidine kinase